MNDAGDAVVAWSGRHGRGNQVVKAAVRHGRGRLLGPGAKSPPRAPTSSIPTSRSTPAATRPWSGVAPTGPTTIAQVAGYDAGPPEMRGLSIPATGTVGVPVTFSASPFDVWPIASTSFNFGDGTGARGTSVSHTYSAPGVYPVTATAVDAAGTPVSASGDDRDLALLRRSRIGKRKLNTKKGTATLTVDGLRSRPGRRSRARR